MVTSETTASFGYWVRRRRLALDLTQAELAQQVACATITIAKIERDERRPSQQMAELLAARLAIPAGERERFVAAALGQRSMDGLPMAQSPLVNPVPLRPNHNLPAPATPLLGRERELALLAQLLADPASRLVTILSSGGTGKTHLAIAAAMQEVEHFAHSVCWMPLAPLTDPEQLMPALAAALNLPLQSGHPPEQQIGDFLRAKHLLLVLDNFEHLLAAAASVGELLAKAPQLAILVTSRQRLKLSSETVLNLDGLAFPTIDTGAGALDSPAVQLFLLHARRAAPHYQPDDRDLAGIVEICRLVQGMPLGILLAAAWSRVMVPAEIAAEIGRDPGFLQSDMRDIPARQRNLRALFLHTWGRLSSAEQDVFMQLSVFRGGATTTAARQVTGASIDVLAGLVDQALLRRLPSGRYEIHELLRQFAAEQLAAAGSAREYAAQAQHSRYYLVSLAAEEQRLQGPEQRAALDIISADFENIVVAWRWAVHAHEFDHLAPAVLALYLYCEIQGTYADGATLFNMASDELAHGAATVYTQPPALQPLLGKLLVRLGACTFSLGDCEGGEKQLRAGLQLVTEERERAFALAELGWAVGEQGNPAGVRVLSLESLEISRKCNDTAGVATALQCFTFRHHDYVESCRLLDESLALWRQVGRPDRIANVLNYLGMFIWFIGDYARAEACWNEALALCEALNLRKERAWSLDQIGLAAWYRGDMVAAERCLQETMAIYTEIGSRVAVGMCMAELALILGSTDRVAKAIALARQAVSDTRTAGSLQFFSYALIHLGAVLTVAGALAEARSSLREGIQRAWQGGYDNFCMIALYFYAELLEQESRTAEPENALACQRIAVALLSHARVQQETWAVIRDKSDRLLAVLASALPPEPFAAAQEAGASLAVEAVVNAVWENRLDRLAGPLPAISASQEQDRFVPAELPPMPHGDHSGHSPQPAGLDLAPRTVMHIGDHDWVLVEPLTQRELDVLRLVAARQSNQEIATRLVITPGTAKWYVSQIIAKLGVRSRTQAVARARDFGLLAWSILLFSGASLLLNSAG